MFAWYNLSTDPPTYPQLFKSFEERREWIKKEIFNLHEDQIKQEVKNELVSDNPGNAWLRGEQEGEL